jgi:uncharacterized SAM-binding protein YcdF (DUF218 family)
MIYLHKLLPLLLSPIVIVCILVGYGSVKRKPKVALIGIALLYFFSTPLISDQLFRFTENYAIKQNPNTLPIADAIVVLSGMLTSVQSSDGIAKEWTDPDRFFGGVELYRLGKSRRLVFTGGLLPWEKHSTPEGVTLKKYAVEMGIPEKDIFVTEEAQNTEQEASTSKKLLNRGKPSILLVTSAYHMPRAKLLFEVRGFVVYPYVVDFKVDASHMTLMDLFPNPHALYLTDMAIREQIGLMYYRIRSM